MNSVVDTIRLLDDEPVREVVDLSTGAHKVLRVNGQYLVKVSANHQALEREAVGLYLFGRLSCAVPHLITQGDSFLVAECLVDCCPAFEALEKGLVTTDQISTFVAGVMAKIYWKYQRRDNNVRLFPFLSWEKRIEYLIAGTEKSRTAIVRSFGSEQWKYLLASLRRMSEDKSISRHLTLLHRDIHLENILVSMASGYPRMMLIDMEHCMEGPVELELQNALFWHDDKSVDVAAICGRLTGEFRVPYRSDIEKQMVSVYLADQLLLAIAQQDDEKLATLCRLARAWV